MENKEEILQSLEEFSKHSGGKISRVLEDYLCKVASTGVTVFPWSKLKPLLIYKLDSVIQEFQERCPISQQSVSPNVEHVTFDVMRKRLIDSINQFNGIPFTIQRLCELVTSPTKHYRRTDKFMRGVEKNLVVVTTVDPFGNRIVNENKSEANGIEVGSQHNALHQSDSLVSSFLPPTSPAMSTTGSWFSGLSSVVDSPSSYPNWNSQETSGTDEETENNESVALEPPRKMPRLDKGVDEHEAGQEESPEASAANVDEQKAIAPLLTQLLSASGSVEQKASTSEEQARANQTDESTDSEDSIRTVGTSETGSSESLPDSTLEEGNTGISEAESESRPTSSANACDSATAFGNFSSADKTPSQHFGEEEQFAESSENSYKGIPMAICEEKDPMQSSADCSEPRDAVPHEHDMQQVASSTCDVTETSSSNKWSSAGERRELMDIAVTYSSNIEEESALDASDMNVSFADTEASASGSEVDSEVRQEWQQTSTELDATNSDSENSNISEALSQSTGGLTESKSEEEVDSNTLDSAVTSPMETD